jgi:hypothetical protein
VAGGLRCSLSQAQRPEIVTINQSQRNPFPANDPLHASYHPGEFRKGHRWFQFFPAIDDRHGVRAVSPPYHLPKYMPGALPIAFDGADTLYLFDMRQPTRAGDYPVVCAHSSNLGLQAEECIRVADTFLNACRDPMDIDEPT